jgi:hypothetical protein
MKFLHSVSAIGMAGGLAAYVIVLLTAPAGMSLGEHAALRTGLAGVSSWLIVPSMLVTIVTGLLAMTVHYPFMNQPWVWVKALTGLLIFEATLASIDAPAQQTAKALADAAGTGIGPAEVARLMRDEWSAWWILLGLSVANVALAIWRPKFGLRPGT